MPDTVYATLRISVNDTRRVETVLMPGKRENQISFALSAEDLSRKYLRIRYCLTGTSTVNICGGAMQLSLSSSYQTAVWRD